MDPTTTRYITERTVDDLRDTLHDDAGWPRSELVGPLAPQVNVMLADDRITGDFVLLAEAHALVLTNPNPLPHIRLFRRVAS